MPSIILKPDIARNYAVNTRCWTMKLITKCRTVRQCLHKIHRHRRGQSLVELALVMPVILVILLGAVDLGRAYYFQVSITDAAREGVRVASNPSRNDSDIRAAVVGEGGSTITIDADRISIDPSPTRTSGHPVTVTVSYDFTTITPLVGMIVDEGILNISGSASAVVQ
jgi:Flp pilus assembly protein TadG